MFDFLSEKFSSIFTKILGSGRLDQNNIEETLRKVEDAFLEADVPLAVVKEFSSQIKTEVIGQKILTSLKPAEHLMKLVNDKLIQFLSDGAADSQFSFSIPSTIMVLGLQGSGKTTTIAKIVQNILEQAGSRGKKRKILIASVDFYRPAAIDQLEILSKSINSFGSEIIFYRSPLTDPVKAAQDIANKAKQESCDFLFLDTAGRMHVDENMMLELKNIDLLLKPKYKLLVLDSMTGQESLSVAQAFLKNLDFTGAVLTKMDSQTKGGAAFAFRYTLKKPILFVGTGEKIQDLEQFRPDRIASRMLGMGDLASLLEKASVKVKQADQEALYKSFQDGRLTLQDFASQMEMISKLGSLSTLAKYMPGAGGLKLSEEEIQRGELEMKKFKAVMSSMTRKERLVPKILDSSRKKRIAKGAGVSVSDVDLLLSRFEQSQQFAKIFKKMGKFQNIFK